MATWNPSQTMWSCSGGLVASLLVTLLISKGVDARRRVDCTKFVFAPVCRGVAAKRGEPTLPNLDMLKQTSPDIDTYNPVERAPMELDVPSSADAAWNDDAIYDAIQPSDDVSRDVIGFQRPRADSFSSKRSNDDGSFRSLKAFLRRYLSNKDI